MIRFSDPLWLTIFGFSLTMVISMIATVVIVFAVRTKLQSLIS